MTDWEEQRRSFAYGNANIDNPNVTREMVDAAADKLTGIPVIDRLDAIKQAADSNDDETFDLELRVRWEDALVEAYDDLRAELLRLQEERDYWQGLVVYADENGAFPHGEILQLTAQRDALLEALKECREHFETLEMGHALARVSAAIDNVEGTE